MYKVGVTQVASLNEVAILHDKDIYIYIMIYIAWFPTHGT